MAWAVRSVELAGFPGTEEERREKRQKGKGNGKRQREKCHCGSQRRQAMRGTGVPVVFTLSVLYCPVLSCTGVAVTFALGSILSYFILIICWYKIGDPRSLSFLSFSPRSIFPPSPRLPVSLSNRPASGHIRFYRAAADWPPGPEPVTDPRIRSFYRTVPYRMFVPCRGPPAGCYLQVHLTVEITAVVGN